MQTLVGHNSNCNRALSDIKKVFLYFSVYKQEQLISISPNCCSHSKGTHIILTRKMEEHVLGGKGRSEASLDAFYSLDSIRFFVQVTSFKVILFSLKHVY